MAKVFISHSKRDEKIKDLFFRGFANSGVHQVLKEYENISPPGSKPGQMSKNMAEEIEENILESAAVFVILTETVQNLQHTAHWIVWESAQAKAKKKPIWIFEPYESHRKITITIPHFTHYVRFQMNDETRKFIHLVAASYNDTPVFAAGGGAVGGGLLAGPVGAIVGGIVGYLLSNKVETPKGFSAFCDNCMLGYEVYIPGDKGEFRCANCNKIWTIV